MKSIEHSEQVSLMKWWGLMHKRFGISEQLLFAIPNGGQRNVIVAARMKAEGVRAGVPDLFLAVPSFGYNGLFIELKKPKGGRVSDKQTEFISELSERGYRVTVCHGFMEAKQTIENYLKGAINNEKGIQDAQGNHGD